MQEEAISSTETTSSIKTTTVGEETYYLKDCTSKNGKMIITLSMRQGIFMNATPSVTLTMWFNTALTSRRFRKLKVVNHVKAHVFVSSGEVHAVHLCF